jgi:hypothetical protein
MIGPTEFKPDHQENSSANIKINETNLNFNWTNIKTRAPTQKTKKKLKNKPINSPSKATHKMRHQKTQIYAQNTPHHSPHFECSNICHGSTAAFSFSFVTRE